MGEKRFGPASKGGHGLECVFCGCSERDACIVGDGHACFWVSTRPPVCSAASCLARWALYVPPRRVPKVPKVPRVAA